MIGEDGDELRRAVDSSIDVAVWDGPVTSCGRVEILPFVHDRLFRSRTTASVTAPRCLAGASRLNVRGLLAGNVRNMGIDICLTGAERTSVRCLSAGSRAA